MTASNEPDPALVVRSKLLRLPFLLVAGPALMGVYVLINLRSGVSPVPVTMPDWVPFWPPLAAVYLAMLPIPWFLTMAIDDAARFWRCIGALLVGFIAISAVWLAYPTRMERPEVSAGWWNELYRHLIAIDRPVNILPCGHTLAPIIVTWYLAEENRRWLWWLLPMLAIGTVSIVATWQHRPVDVLIGAVIAAGAILVVKIVDAVGGRGRPSGSREAP